MSSIQERFWAKVDRTTTPDGCWLWTASKTKGGYGQFNMPRNGGVHAIATAHRYSYTLAKGPIPPGMDVCHACDVRHCVNPAHLWVGTRGDNMRDCSSKGRVVVKRGETNKSAKLTAEQVIALRATYAAGGVSHKDLAIVYGVNKATICRILSGKKWAHLSLGAAQ